MNELLLVTSLVISFGAVLVFHRIAGKGGLLAWIAVCAVFANIEVTMLVRAFGLDQTLGNTLFASSFLATDILSELYGKKEADKGVWTGICATVMFIVLSLMWQLYVPADADWASASVRTLFSNTPRILIASLVGYAVSELLDVWLYHKLWDMTTEKTGSREKFLWLRNNAATLISQLVNIVIFNVGAFAGIYSWQELLSITCACYLIYIFTSLLDTPFVYLARFLSIHAEKS